MNEEGFFYSDEGRMAYFFGLPHAEALLKAVYRIFLDEHTSYGQDYLHFLMKEMYDEV